MGLRMPFTAYKKIPGFSKANVKSSSENCQYFPVQIQGSLEIPQICVWLRKPSVLATDHQDLANCVPLVNSTWESNFTALIGKRSVLKNFELTMQSVLHGKECLNAKLVDYMPGQHFGTQPTLRENEKNVLVLWTMTTVEKSSTEQFKCIHSYWTAS